MSMENVIFIRSNELLCNLIRVKIQIYFYDYLFEFLPRRTLHSSSSNIDSYGDYLLAITTDIYHELSEYPLLL